LEQNECFSLHWVLTAAPAAGGDHWVLTAAPAAGGDHWELWGVVVVKSFLLDVTLE